MKFWALGLVVLLSGCAFSAESSKIDISADHFHYDAKLNLILTSGNVIVKRHNMTVTARRGRYDQPNQIVVLYDTVQLSRGDMRLTCDQITVHGRDNQVDAVGNTKFMFLETHGQSDRVLYDLNREFVTLSGHAQVFQVKDEMMGDEIFIDLRQKQFRTTGKARVRLTKDRLPK